MSYTAWCGHFPANPSHKFSLHDTTRSPGLFSPPTSPPSPPSPPALSHPFQALADILRPDAKKEKTLHKKKRLVQVSGRLPGLVWKEDP